jgi:hypothetical protein
MIDPRPADIGRVVVLLLGTGPIDRGLIVGIGAEYIQVQFDVPLEPLPVRREDLIFDRVNTSRVPRQMTAQQRQEREDRIALKARLRSRIASRRRTALWRGAGAERL